MENASKALIMAGAILIAIIIISLGIIIFNNFSNAVKSNTDLSAEEISQFNSKVTPYLGDNISGSQVNALIQTVRSINQKAIQEDTDKTIEINYPGGILNKDNTFTKNRKVATGQYYTVLAEYGDNGLISIIKVSR